MENLIKHLEQFYSENQDDFAQYVMQRDELKQGGYEIDTMENAKYTLQKIEFEGDFENTIWESAYLQGVQDAIGQIKQFYLNNNL